MSPLDIGLCSPTSSRRARYIDSGSSGVSSSVTLPLGSYRDHAVLGDIGLESVVYKGLSPVLIGLVQHVLDRVVPGVGTSQRQHEVVPTTLQEVHSSDSDTGFDRHFEPRGGLVDKAVREHVDKSQQTRDL